MRLLLSVVLGLGLSFQAFGALVSNTELRGLPTLPVDDSIAQHAVEKRGFVQVPWDYERPRTGKLHVFYRFIPSSAGADAPTLIFMNGGPGLASSMMRPLDYDYSKMPSDRLTVLLSTFNVVLVDQRGTAGGTYPLNQNNLNRINLAKIALTMNADILAQDHARVAKALIAKGLMTPSKYYVMGHSFGLQIAQSYVRLAVETKINLLPKGMILSAGQLGDPAWTWIGARPNLEQFGHGLLNYSIQNGLEPFNRLMIRAKTHFASIGVDPNMVHYAYTDSITGDYAADYDYVLELMQMNSKEEIESYLHDYSDVFGALNPVLSIQSLNGGRMAAELLAFADQYHHLEDWMIDPLKAFVIDDTYLPYKHRKLRSAIRAGSIKELKRPNGDQFRTFMTKTKLMFHWGRTDLIAGAEAGKQTVIDLLGEEIAKEVTYLTSGGHKDIRTAEGLQLIKNHFGL